MWKKLFLPAVIKLMKKFYELMTVKITRIAGTILFTAVMYKLKFLKKIYSPV